MLCGGMRLSAQCLHRSVFNRSIHPAVTCQTLIINRISVLTLSSSLWDLLLNRYNALFQPLGEDVAALATVGVCGAFH